MTIRVVLQSVERAAILVDNAERYACVGRGVIVYIAFLKEVGEEMLQQAVRTITAARVFQHIPPDGTSAHSTVSLDDCPVADILIVPQASLGGKLKGRNVQFHALVNKAQGSALYERFCELLREARKVDAVTVDSNGVPLNETSHTGEMQCAGRVISGTYGNRQGLRFESEGPLTHLLDI